MKLPIEISQLLTRLESNGFEAFVVGGCVRDTLLGKNPTDWDICTSAYPEEVQTIFSDHRVIPTGLKHGTITVASGEMYAEITTYRQDGEYTDHRHPESVRYTKSLREDLKRRDFTINAMAYSTNTGLIDYFNGRHHLDCKLLCCVGDPVTRFHEDALRILRGLRFAASYDLTIENETAKAIHHCKDGLSSISAERIFVELRKTLQAGGFSSILSGYPDILGILFPDASEHFIFSEKWENFIRNLSDLPESFSLRFSSLLYWLCESNNYADLCRSILHKLKPDKKTATHVLSLIECQCLPLPASLPETRRFVGRYGSKILTEILIWRLIQHGDDITAVKNYLKEIHENNLCCTIKELAISGHQLKKAGVFGVQIGQELQRGLDAVINGIIPNTEESLIKFLFS